MGFLPTAHQTVKPAAGAGGNYFKPLDGKNKVRIMGDAIVGFVYWSDANRPVRTETHPGQPADARISDRDGKPDKPKYFWAMTVWDYADSQIKLWECTQRGIQEAIEALVEDEDWGHPSGFDLTVTRTGQGLETKYQVVPSPKKEASAAQLNAFKDAAIDLQALFRGDNPFGAAKNPPPASHPDWDVFLAKLKEVSNQEQLEKLSAWVRVQKRYDALSTTFPDLEDRLSKHLDACHMRLSNAAVATVANYDEAPF